MIYILSLNIFELNFFSYIILFSFFIFGVITCTLINHNHRHHPIFKKNLYNQYFNYLISFIIGAPSTRLHLVHHFNHHYHYPSHKDWTHFQHNGHGKGITKILTYLYSASLNMTKNRDQLIRTRHNKNALRNEKIVLYLLSLIALMINWRMFIVIVIPGWIIGLSMLLTSNLVNHDQCDISSPLNHSRDFLNKIENWFFCNNGYHTAHHIKPHLHWEELPNLHSKVVASCKDQKYISDSFFAYLIRYCLKKS